MDERDGTSSYVIDLPNGGRSFIIGNIIHHGPHAENGVAVSYAAEGAKNTVQELYVVNNTYINERAASGSFLRVAGTPPVVRVINNIVIGTKTVLTGPGESTNNLVFEVHGGKATLLADNPTRVMNAGFEESSGNHSRTGRSRTMKG